MIESLIESLKENLKVGDLVQLDPAYHLGERSGFFAGCFMVVTELKSFGAMGYIPIPGNRGEMPGMAYYRAKWEEMHIIGQAIWAVDEKADEIPG